jgi:glycosyltransferase involved in cell wall biosynthesis
VEWLVGRADVVHGTNFIVPPARRAARVVTVHDLTTLRFPELCNAQTLRFPDLVRRAIGEGAWVHTPSQAVADEVISEFGADPARVRAVHHGIPALPPANSAGAPGVDLPAGIDRYILAIGTAEPRKDLPGLVHAFDLLAPDHPELALVLAGPAGWGAAALDRAVDGSPWSNRIVRTGFVADARLAVLLAGAYVLAYPSVYEGFGFPPLQAMAAGVPVVATSVPAVREVVGGAALLVAPGDAEALAAGLARVLDDGVLWQRLADLGGERARLFTWEESGQRLAALYASAYADAGIERS